MGFPCQMMVSCSFASVAPVLPRTHGQTSPAPGTSGPGIRSHRARRSRQPGSPGLLTRGDRAGSAAWAARGCTTRSPGGRPTTCGRTPCSRRSPASSPARHNQQVGIMLVAPPRPASPARLDPHRPPRQHQPSPKPRRQEDHPQPQPAAPARVAAPLGGGWCGRRRSACPEGRRSACPGSRRGCSASQLAGSRPAALGVPPVIEIPSAPGRQPPGTDQGAWSPARRPH